MANIKYYILLIFTFLFLFNISITSVFSQELTASEIEMKENAYNLFVAKNFEEALPFFSQLLSIYPKDPEFNYGYGVCLVEVNRETKKALKYLNYALTSIDNSKIYYYIGKAYHFNYNFLEAINSFEEFKQKASKKELAESDVNRLIEMCNSGTELVKYANQLIILENKQVKKENFFKSYEINDFGGNIISKPIEFKTKIDKKLDQSSIMIYSPERDVYISSYGENKTNKKDLYSLKKQPDGTWSKPINLGAVINTPFDEDYPYIHPDGKTLYFCSKGHNSMGGYDIFRSIYDSTTSSWSKPTNLDFPTNSPYDDIFYVSDKNEDIAYFSSNRETDKEKTSVYKIQVEKNPVKVKIQSIDDIIQTARLDITIMADNNTTNNRRGSLLQLDPIRDRVTETFDFVFLDLNTPLSKGEIYNEAQKDAEQLNSKSKLMEQDANYAIYYASEKNKLSNQRKEEAENSKQIGETQNAELLIKESNDLAREAVVAYNLADNLKNISSQVKTDAYNASEFSKYLESQEYLDKTNLVTELNKNREKLSQSQKKYITVESEQIRRKTQLEEQSTAFETSQKNFEQLQKEIIEIEGEMKTVDNSITIEKNPTISKKLQNHRTKLIAQYEEKKMQANTMQPSYQKLKIQTSNLKVEVAVVSDLLAKMNGNPDEYIVFSEKAKSLDKEKFSKEIFDKEIATDLMVYNESKESIKDQNIAKETVVQQTNTENNIKPEEVKTDVAVNTEAKQEIAANTEVKTETPENTEIKTDVAVVNTDVKQEVVANPEIKTEIAENTEVKSDTAINAAKEEPEIKLTSSNAQVLYEQSQKNEQIADSLTKIVEQKRQDIKKIKNVKERTKVQKEINQLEDIALAKKQQAASDLKQASELENAFIAENNKVDTTKANQTELADNLIEKDPDFAINSATSKTDNYINDNLSYSFLTNNESTNIEKYKKETFKAQYYNNIAKENKKQLAILQSSIEKVTDDQTKLAIQTKIDELSKTIEDSNIKSEEYNKSANNHKTAAIEEIPSDGISYEDLLVEATKYKPEIDPGLNKKQKDESFLINQDKTQAKVLLDDWTKRNNEIKKREENNKRPLSKNEKATLEKSKKALEGKFKEANDLFETAHEDEYNLYVTLLTKNRIISETENGVLANNLEKEANLYFEKAKIIRESSKKIKTNNNTDELIKAKNLETIALQKQKQANDLYLKIKLNPLDTLVASKETLAKNKITLLPEEEKMLKEYKEADYNAAKIKTQAEADLAEVNQKREEANTTDNKNDKEKLLKESEEKELNVKNELVTACKLAVSADSVRFFLYKNQLQQLSESITDVKNNKLISKQYINEAELYYAEAKNIRLNSENLTNIDDKIKELERASKYDKMALNSQEIAIDALIEPEPIIFVTDNALIKIDRLEALNTPMNIDKVKKADTPKIIEKLNLSSEEITSLNQGALVEKDIAAIELEVKTILTNIEELNSKVSNTSSNKEKKDAEKELKILETKLVTTQASAAELQEVVNDAKYNIYKEHIASLRLKGNADLARQGQQLEGDANKSYNKAKLLRLQTSLVGKGKGVYDLLIEANKLELTAIEEIEKAYSIYLGLQPSDGQLVAQQGVKNEDILIKSKADITPLEVKTTDVVDNKQVLELNDGSDQIVAKTDTVQPKVENIVVDNNQIVAKSDTIQQITEAKTDSIPQNLVVENKQDIQPETNLEVNNNANNQDQVVAVKDTIQQIAEVKTDSVPQNLVLENKQDIQPQTDIEINNTENQTQVAAKNEVIEPKVEINNKVENQANANTELNPKDLVIKADEEIIDYSLKNTPVYTEATPIPLNPTLQEGLVFKIQIGAFKNAIPQSSFKGLTPVCGERLGNSKFTKYLVGLFRTVDASKLVLTEVKQMGYKDAFIVAYLNGKRISLYEARNLIKAGSPDFVQNYNIVAQKEVSKLNNRSEIEKIIATNTIKNAVVVDQVNQNKAKADSATAGVASVQAIDVTSVTGLMYTVQIGVFKNLVTSQQLFNLSPIYKEQTPYTFVRYTCGIYNSMNQAIAEKDRIVKIGIPDAFVTAYYNGKRINPIEAKNIEQSNGAGVFAKTNNAVVPENQAAEIKKQPTTYTEVDKASIVFKIQIGAYKEQVPTTMVDAFLKVASTQGLDQTKIADGTTIYTVGKFKSYEEATKIKDALVNEGVKDAFVIAYKGEQKISVNEAKNILNQ